MGLLKFIIALVIAGAIITQLENIGADKKLSKAWQIVIGGTIGVGVWAVLNLLF